MKVRITASGLPVPIGTIMEVGEKAPAAWAGKYEPVIMTQAEIMDELIEDSADLIDEKPHFRRKRNG